MQHVENFIKKHQLLSSAKTVVVGVSGGPDSLALLHFLWKRSAKYRIKVVAASFDHTLRGEESAREQSMVEQFCLARNIPFEGGEADVANFQKKNHLSPQTAARICRYDFFERVMKKFGADTLALAHHGDDQIETMLMRMTRGSEGYSLAGIPVKRPFTDGEIIRPFLGITKAEIEQYCKVEDLNPIYDPSNESEKYIRNRFRKKVLPFLKEENPNVHERFQYLSETITEDEAYIIHQTEIELEKVLIVKAEGKIELSVSAFNKMPIPLQKRGITLILNYLYKLNPSSLSSVHKENFLSLLGSEHPSGFLHFPSGLFVSRTYDRCTLSFVPIKNEEPSYDFPMDIPGIAELPIGILTAETTDCEPDSIRGKDVFVFSPNDVSLPLRVRNRRLGDRMAIAGVGTRKLKDIFIDAKVVPEERKIWPVVVDANDDVIWLPGLKHTERKSLNQSEQWVILRFQKNRHDV
ncbi:tRNA lysidine(34) synthetase TilS [Fictibacillus phosphorivorans]|uniref:tRNA lysidine(34) synthetase TilS n=1 Tax=Fictibacillus phosphorivorans TaxID=1221500 RepID=UPI00203BF3AD|nr:tRNA lysidine(34) synthetase TilS [Fictibacillus phosphorivorans]MCM3719862.1 tRNA lysidine(34) synthetase TilS [Fictibacillus phosphorivorans]MCM3777552.1 tRNA lysidine(34) synthetase TilS [Fictibacillus phosphorivorans]